MRLRDMLAAAVRPWGRASSKYAARLAWPRGDERPLVSVVWSRGRFLQVEFGRHAMYERANVFYVYNVATFCDYQNTRESLVRLQVGDICARIIARGAHAREANAMQERIAKRGAEQATNDTKVAA